MEKMKNGMGAIVVVIAIAILILITVGGLLIQQKRSAFLSEQQGEMQITADIGVNPTPTKTQIKPADAADAKLDVDFAGIDKSMGAIDAEFFAVDAGLNDQMGDLSE
ncbi:MAG: hypothetical protein V1917_00780 [Candidatus Gottesmanbacteria bacterium]